MNVARVHGPGDITGVGGCYRSLAMLDQERTTMNVCSSRTWVSSRIGMLLAVAMLTPIAIAQTYAVNIKPTLHDLDIKIEPVATTAMLVIKLTNRTDAKVRCDLRYDAAPQTPYQKTTYVDPGKTEQSTFRAKRKWLSVDVDVECKPVHAS